MSRTYATSKNPPTDLSGYLKLDQTTPQTTVGTFTFPNTVTNDLGIKGLVGDETVLLLHLDSGYTDSSLTPKTITPNGSVAIDNSNYKFGGGSATFNTATQDFLSIPVSDDFNFGSGDFTIDFWLYNPSGLTQEAVFAGYNDFWLAIGANWGSFGEHRIFLSSNGYSWDIIQGDSGAGISNYNGLLADQWNHFALVRHGNNLMTFVNGIKDIGTTISGSIVNPTITQPSLSIGRWGANPMPMLTGNIDEFRVVKGIAKWTADFIPPIAPYTIAPISVTDHITITSTDLFNFDKGIVAPKFIGDGSLLTNVPSSIVESGTNPGYAANADYANSAGSATSAGYADSAGFATSAGQAPASGGHADSADYAGWADSAGNAYGYNLSGYNNDLGNYGGWITGIDGTMVTNALGFTPYSDANPSGFISGIDSSMVTTALGYTPINPSGTSSQYIKGDGSLATFPSIPAAQIQSDWNQTNNALLDYIKNKPTIPSVGTWGALNYPTWASGTPFVKMTAAGTFALDSSTYLTSISSSNVTTALGYTPVTNARTLTINGTAYDLTANRSWTIASGPSLGTTTQIPYMNVAGTDFLYGSGLTFNGTVLSSSGGVITNKIYPSADSTTALQFYKSNGTTNVLTLDTTNSRLGIGVTPTVALDVVGTGHFSGETTTYYGVKINTGQALTCRTTNDNSYGHVMKYSDANSEYFTIGTVNDSTAIILANGWQFLNPASSGRPSGSAIGLFQQNRKVSIRNYNDGVSTQIMTALLTIGAGAATAGNAPLKFITGPTLSIPELGAVEFNDPNIYFTPTGVLGPETFSSFLRTNWTLNTGWDATNAGDTKINKNAAGTATAILTTPLPTIGRAYTITITCDTYSGGGRVYVSYGGVSIPLGFGYFYQTDTLTATITATSTAGLTFTPDTSATRASFSAISIKLAAIEKKPFVLTDGANLTSGKVPVASTNGRLVDSAGVSGSFTTVDSKTVTVTNGLITSIV